MKKKNIIFIILICIVILLAIATTYILLKRNKDNINEHSTEISDTANILDAQENVNNEILEEKINTYVDENPVKLGIYIKNGNTLKLIKDTYTCGWAPEEIMGLFFVIPTTEENVQNITFSKLWKNYINKYPNPEKYRIGYNIKFTLNTDEVIDRTILNPGDAYHMFPKVMVFLYDDVNFVSGQRYYHITDMTDDTICSSIKLVGDVETKNITSDIELTAFSFDTEDDFDEETNKYRGNSSYTITIKKK